MALFENCLLASDVDGTLVDTGIIAQRNIEKIKYFCEQGGTFVIATGRSSGAIGQVFNFIDKSLLGPCVFLNGGMIYDFNNEKELYADLLPEHAKLYAKTVFEKHPDIGIEVHSNSRIFVLKATAETELHEDYEMLDREYVTFDDIKDENWNKILYACDDQAACDRLAGTLRSIDGGDCFFVQTGVVINGVMHIYFEQMPKGTNKGKGLKKLCEILNIKKGGCFAIGDYYNDLEMLRAADVSATMANSPEDIKEIVNFVGGTCLDGGVADFIEYLSKSEVQK
ncbi:MAG: HAD family hydrolase [Acutalibacteraceae bacterium]|nr:HAD family hydrolase [Acutalibacteraceae bacterium]